MAEIRWSVVWDIMQALDWENWSELCRRMGISDSHLSDVRSGRRAVSMAFADLLIHALNTDYNRVLIHPTLLSDISAKDIFVKLALDDERPWPAGELKHGPPMTTYQQHQKERFLARQLRRRTAQKLFT